MKVTLSNSAWKTSFDDAYRSERNFGGGDELRKRKTSIELIANAGAVRDYNYGFFLDYDIFPSSIMTSKNQWNSAAREMEVGDLILQRIFMPPLGGGICIECAVRVCSIVDEARSIGFAYETLEGHVEKGISQFLLVKNSGGLVFSIETQSAPAFLVTRLISPISNLYQDWCTRQALRYVKRRFQQVNRL